MRRLSLKEHEKNRAKGARQKTLSSGGEGGVGGRKAARSLKLDRDRPTAAGSLCTID